MRSRGHLINALLHANHDARPKHLAVLTQRFLRLNLRLEVDVHPVAVRCHLEQHRSRHSLHRYANN